MFMTVSANVEKRIDRYLDIRGFEARIIVPKNPSPQEMLDLAEVISLLIEQLDRAKSVLPEHAWDQLQDKGPKFHIDWCNSRGNTYMVTEDYTGGGSGLITGTRHWITMRCYNDMVKRLKTQPYIILHELAHSWHDGFISDGFNNQEIKSAFDSAKEYYEMHDDTGKPYYWTTDGEGYYGNEYFAEFSVIYFAGQSWGKLRSKEDLRDRDIDLIKRMWGIK